MHCKPRQICGHATPVFSTTKFLAKARNDVQGTTRSLADARDDDAVPVTRLPTPSAILHQYSHHSVLEGHCQKYFHHGQ